MLRSGNDTHVGISQSDALGNVPSDTMERKASEQLSHSPVRLGEPFPKHLSTLADGNFSLGSAAVGAALSSVPLLRSLLGLEREQVRSPAGEVSRGSQIEPLKKPDCSPEIAA